MLAHSPPVHDIILPTDLTPFSPQAVTNPVTLSFPSHSIDSNLPISDEIREPLQDSIRPTSLQSHALSSDSLNQQLYDIPYQAEYIAKLWEILMNLLRVSPHVVHNGIWSQFQKLDGPRKLAETILHVVLIGECDTALAYHFSSNSLNSSIPSLGQHLSSSTPFLRMSGNALIESSSVLPLFMIIDSLLHFFDFLMFFRTQSRQSANHPPPEIQSSLSTGPSLFASVQSGVSQIGMTVPQPVQTSTPFSPINTVPTLPSSFIAQACHSVKISSGLDSFEYSVKLHSDLEIVMESSLDLSNSVWRTSSISPDRHPYSTSLVDGTLSADDDFVVIEDGEDNPRFLRTVFCEATKWPLLQLAVLMKFHRIARSSPKNMQKLRELSILSGFLKMLPKIDFAVQKRVLSVFVECATSTNTCLPSEFAASSASCSLFNTAESLEIVLHTLQQISAKVTKKEELWTETVVNVAMSLMGLSSVCLFAVDKPTDLVGHVGRLCAVKTAQSVDMVATADDRGRVVVWNLWSLSVEYSFNLQHILAQHSLPRSFSSEHSLPPHSTRKPISPIAFVPHTSALYASSGNVIVEMDSRGRMVAKEEMSERDDEVTVLECVSERKFGEEKKVLLTGHRNGKVRMWETSSLERKGWWFSETVVKWIEENERAGRQQIIQKRASEHQQSIEAKTEDDNDGDPLLDPDEAIEDLQPLDPSVTLSPSLPAMSIWNAVQSAEGIAAVVVSSLVEITFEKATAQFHWMKNEAGNKMRCLGCVNVNELHTGLEKTTRDGRVRKSSAGEDSMLNEADSLMRSSMQSRHHAGPPTPFIPASSVSLSSQLMPSSTPSSPSSPTPPSYATSLSYSLSTHTLAVGTSDGRIVRFRVSDQSAPTISLVSGDKQVDCARCNTPFKSHPRTLCRGCHLVVCPDCLRTIPALPSHTIFTSLKVCKVCAANENRRSLPFGGLVHSIDRLLSSIPQTPFSKSLSEIKLST
ncbi:hypothetical protein BLNAU_14990 [Blattamonas nauphoetae]|uniref:FYVE-type domain-containing protein n=1 Tax=Blattamonas nauphoetae TaxID=2049346 RepID=A0ABQ9XC36_9EUKA|nr:hypothetical protein BLNAU_14990 [Blattamonas nauphoetae]